MIIKIATSESDATLERVRSAIEAFCLQEPGWGTVDYTIEWDDHTCIEGLPGWAHESRILACIYRQLDAAVAEREYCDSMELE